MIFEPIIEDGLPVGTSLYGTGEVSGQLERTGKRVFTWNTDAWGYGSGTTSLYQSHPWVLAVLPTGEALGILTDTTRRWTVFMPPKWSLDYHQCRWSYDSDKKVQESNRVRYKLYFAIHYALIYGDVGIVGSIDKAQDCALSYTYAF
ncbi:unnamed protein product [Prunus brigantina]